MDIRPVSFGAEPQPSLFEKVGKLVRTQRACIGPKFGERKPPKHKRKAVEIPKTPEKRTSLYDEGCTISLLA